MKILRDLLTIAALAASLAAGYVAGRRSVAVTTVETLRIDTLYYAAPVPVRTLPPEVVTVRLPRVLFAPADTAVRRRVGSTDRASAGDAGPEVLPAGEDTLAALHAPGSGESVGGVPAVAGSPGLSILAAGGDSVELRVPVERRQYGDSTYRAQVSGPAVGELRPSLDWIEVYSRTTARVQTATRRSRFAVTAGVGVGYTPQGLQPYVGVGVGMILWQW